MLPVDTDWTDNILSSPHLKQSASNSQQNSFRQLRMIDTPSILDRWVCSFFIACLGLTLPLDFPV